MQVGENPGVPFQGPRAYGASANGPSPLPPQTVNAILIVTMVPIVDAVVYPLIAKCFNFT